MKGMYTKFLGKYPMPITENVANYTTPKESKIEGHKIASCRSLIWLFKMIFKTERYIIYKMEF